MADTADFAQRLADEFDAYVAEHGVPGARQDGGLDELANAVRRFQRT